MNESLERALNEVSILKKTLNSEKTSHQNTLQQLETTYQIIEEMKEMLRNQQDKNKTLLRQVKEKNSKIQEISRQYEDQIMDIKELIERKDLQIRKYTQIKVTDYDMIRFRVINEVEAQHHEEMELLRKQIQRQQFINNQSVYEIKLIKQKNLQYVKEIEQLNQKSKAIEEQLSTNHLKQINKVYGLLENQKLTKKQLEKRIEKEKEKYTETIKKYHKQMETLQTQLMHQGHGKQNIHRHSNLNNSSSLIQVKESEFALQNEKLKRQIRQKNEQLDELTKRHKSETRQLNRRIDELQKELREAHYEIKKLQEDFKDSKISVEQEITNKWKKELEKKQKNLKENYEAEILEKERQLQKLKKQLQQIKNSSNRNESYKFGPKLQDERQDSFKLQRENEQLKGHLKKSTLELEQLKNKIREEQNQNRQTRAVSVHDVKDKLKAANAKIVTLLKDKIDLNEKIAKMNERK